ncbi:hypothetical protein F511_34595 [Dorcoceras hygrometricum]|uniref:Uncharacterized protein n=1 Tax=Dorcoceras hygrometricum TaxID=472368 RepID=A0A2Z7D7E9_9LAMI|nr:hypothetical protein F511_34595 [Dorcoceras hygrometricum]
MLYLTCATYLDWSRREDIQARTVKGRLSWTGRRYQAGIEQTKNKLVKDKPAGQNLQEQTVKEDLSSEDDEGEEEISEQREGATNSNKDQVKEDQIDEPAGELVKVKPAQIA